MKTLMELVEELPPDLRQEVWDFAQYLLQTKVRRRATRLDLKWRGALRDLRDQYTSVELQHRALEWRGH